MLTLEGTRGFHSRVPCQGSLSKEPKRRELPRGNTKEACEGQLRAEYPSPKKVGLFTYVRIYIKPKPQTPKPEPII